MARMNGTNGLFVNEPGLGLDVAMPYVDEENPGRSGALSRHDMTKLKSISVMTREEAISMVNDLFDNGD